jgi:hypothetical protein
MNSVPRKTLRMISVVAAVCLFQVYVLAAATAPNAVAANPNATANGLMLGRLMLAGTESILVNGNSANSGTTILSGSQLQTPEDVEATVQLGSAGALYIEPNTNLTLTFDKTNVNVKVAAGNAFVAANAGVMSSVTTPDGKTSITAGEAGAPPVPKMSKGKKTAAIAIPVIVGVVLIIYFVTRNSS